MTLTFMLMLSVLTFMFSWPSYDPDFNDYVIFTWPWHSPRHDHHITLTFLNLFELYVTLTCLLIMTITWAWHSWNHNHHMTLTFIYTWPDTHVAMTSTTLALFWPWVSHGQDKSWPLHDPDIYKAITIISHTFHQTLTLVICKPWP